FFNVVAYYQIGYRAAKIVLNLFYKVTVAHEDEAAPERPRPNGVPVYLMNHRSNADYVLVSHALTGEPALSYPLGASGRGLPLARTARSCASSRHARGGRGHRARRNWARWRDISGGTPRASCCAGGSGTVVPR